MSSNVLIERSGRALGSPLRMVVAGDESAADRAWMAIERVFADVDAAMSRFREDSALTHLCRESPGAVDDVPRMLVRALVAADRARRVTGGSFDPRIVSALERIGYRGVSQGSRAEAPGDSWAEGPGGSWVERPGTSLPIGHGGSRPDEGRIVIRQGRNGPISLPVSIDLGGIGKGLALRWAANTIDWLFRELPRAPLGFLVDAGGDVIAEGRPATSTSWSIGIENPTGASEPIAVLQLPGRGAVATSSISRLRWELEGRTVHHLIDPRTGEPGGDGLISVTVAALDPAWAEVWSKALFLEGSTGIAASARRRGFAAWWVTTDGRLEMTPAARQRTSWVAAEAARA